ncbi:chorismate mutase [Synechococcus sp. M16CYN]|uniref:chorismate mutase n=1 Tax=Synechococcus sp. M16CYN TaxID=3103139 RepID=UPI00324773FB
MNNSTLRLVGLRAATTSAANTVAAIQIAVRDLIDALVEENALTPKRIVSVTFSVTADLDACFPAAMARQRPGWDGVALLDCQQMAVQGDLERCIRILAHAWMPGDRRPIHPYRGKAYLLRPDRSNYD